MQQHSRDFLARADQAMANAAQAKNRSTLGTRMPRQRQQAVEDFGARDFAALRRDFRALRQHTQKHLASYLEAFGAKARENGACVHFARDDDELNRTVTDICLRHEARAVIKGKSMVTEETGLNAALAAAGINVRETDLGEYILQEADETPSHIVAPALHKSEEEIRALFQARHPLGQRDLEDPAAMVAEARDVLREAFTAAEVGIIGSNALIAESGLSLLVTNEGNGDLCANLPPVLIICSTIERVLPRMDDAAPLLRLLARSTTGQPISCYSSFYGRPRRDDDIDGPVEVHFVLLDNGRSDILASDYSEMLQCIRCGACLNHCPIYTSAGGHAYGWVYPGPMGSVLTPLLTSLEESEQLPNACTACGRCAQVCPADIPLPDLLRDLRSDALTEKITPMRWRVGLRVHGWLIQRPALYRRLTGLAVALMHRVGKKSGVVRRLPLAGGWLAARDFPAPSANRTFQQRYAEAGAQRDQRVAGD